LLRRDSSFLVRPARGRARQAIFMPPGAAVPLMSTRASDWQCKQRRLSADSARAIRHE
jgi:hypothetical protein